MNAAILLAAGVGSRLDALAIPKQFYEIGGKPLFCYSLERFENHPGIDEIVIVTLEDWLPYVQSWVKNLGFKKVKNYATQGKSRQHSVLNGLRALSSDIKSNDVVLIHDAARPFVTERVIGEIIHKAAQCGGAMPVLPINDTIYRSVDGSKIDALLLRSELFSGQTPEGFRFERYYEINNAADDNELLTTTGSSAIAFKHGVEIGFVKGDDICFKVTTNGDLERLSEHLKNM